MATTATTYSVTATLRDVANNVTHTIANKVFTPTGFAQQAIQEPSIATPSEVTLALDAAITGGQGPGWAYIQNMDDTNSIHIGMASGVYFATLLKGEAMVLPLHAGVTNLYHQSPAGTPEIRVVIYER